MEATRTPDRGEWLGRLAVMVAGLGRLLFEEGVRAGLDLDALARALAPPPAPAA